MELFWRILISIIGLAFSIVLIKYRKVVMDWTGHWAWANHVWGTANAIVLIALVIMFLSIAYPTGAIDDFLKPQAKNVPTTQAE